MRFVDYPLVVLIVTFAVLSLSTWIGERVRGRREVDDAVRDDFAFVLGAASTLLALVVAFTLSMAVGRYDQRKNLEASEANALGTAYVRAELLPNEDAAKVRTLLRRYVDRRLAFYTAGVWQQNAVENDPAFARLQGDLWAAVSGAAKKQPTPVTALAVAAVNDVLDSSGFTQAAWRNRVPVGAWLLMAAIALCSTMMLGYSARRPRSERPLLLILPGLVAIAFFLIADIDSPRAGMIPVSPENLISLAESLRPN
jgi:hypothetical protein